MCFARLIATGSLVNAAELLCCNDNDDDNDDDDDDDDVNGEFFYSANLKDYAD